MPDPMSGKLDDDYLKNFSVEGTIDFSKLQQKPLSLDQLIEKTATELMKDIESTSQAHVKALEFARKADTEPPDATEAAKVASAGAAAMAGLELESKGPPPPLVIISTSPPSELSQLVPTVLADGRFGFTSDKNAPPVTYGKFQVDVIGSRGVYTRNFQNLLDRYDIYARGGEVPDEKEVNLVVDEARACLQYLNNCVEEAEQLERRNQKLLDEFPDNKMLKEQQSGLHAATERMKSQRDTIKDQVVLLQLCQVNAPLVDRSTVNHLLRKHYTQEQIEVRSLAQCLASPLKEKYFYQNKYSGEFVVLKRGAEPRRQEYRQVSARDILSRIVAASKEYVTAENLARKHPLALAFAVITNLHFNLPESARVPSPEDLKRMQSRHYMPLPGDEEIIENGLDHIYHEAYKNEQNKIRQLQVPPEATSAVAEEEEKKGEAKDTVAEQEAKLQHMKEVLDAARVKSEWVKRQKVLIGPNYSPLKLQAMAENRETEWAGNVASNLETAIPIYLALYKDWSRNVPFAKDICIALGKAIQKQLEERETQKMREAKEKSAG